MFHNYYQLKLFSYFCSNLGVVFLFEKHLEFLKTLQNKLILLVIFLQCDLLHVHFDVAPFYDSNLRYFQYKNFHQNILKYKQNPFSSFFTRFLICLRLRSDTTAPLRHHKLDSNNSLKIKVYLNTKHLFLLIFEI